MAVNGCCLTATAIREGYLTFDLLEETLARTNLRALRPREPGESRARARRHRQARRPFRPGAHRLRTARVLSYAAERGRSSARGGTAGRLRPLRRAQRLGRPQRHQPNDRGIAPESFVVWIIPHTQRQTNFESLQPNDLLNVEFDILAKYVERMLARLIVDASRTRLLRPEPEKDRRDRAQENLEIQA